MSIQKIGIPTKKIFCSLVLVFVLVTCCFSIANTSKAAEIVYDEDHLPVVDYGTIEGLFIGKHYNPITISHYADGYYDKFMKFGDQESKNNFFKHVDWLVNNAITIGNFSFFEYTFPFPYSDNYTLVAPWYSAMAQGEAISRLVKGYQISDNKTYLDTARKALNVLFIDINSPCKCGVTIKNTTEGWWYEEYANGTEQGPRVLNGMMFTLIGINSYYNITKDPDAEYLFNQGIRSLLNNLHIYDKNGTYSYYDKQGFESRSYHDIHVQLLGNLYNITKLDLLKTYHDNWKRGSSS